MSAEIKTAVFKDDDQVVAEVLGGNAEAYTIIYERYKKRILYYVLKFIGKDMQTAEDVTVEVFIRAYKSLSSYKAQGKFGAWLYTIASNLSKNQLRSMKKAVFSSLTVSLNEEGEGADLIDRIPDKGGSPHDSAREHEFKNAVDKAMHALAPKHKQVLILCDMEGLAYEEAAQALGCTPGTVGSR